MSCENGFTEEKESIHRATKSNRMAVERLKREPDVRIGDRTWLFIND